MLKTPLLHPYILRALASSGHGSRILIADGNYPFETASPPTAEKVYLNLRPGTVDVTEVLETLVQVIPIESASVMAPPAGVQPPPIFDTFTGLLPAGCPLAKLERHAFYGEARKSDTSLVIATGERRRFANILITIGVIKEPEA